MGYTESWNDSSSGLGSTQLWGNDLLIFIPARVESMVKLANMETLGVANLMVI